jgi:hypothetical protein
MWTSNSSTAWYFSTGPFINSNLVVFKNLFLGLNNFITQLMYQLANYKFGFNLIEFGLRYTYETTGLWSALVAGHFGEGLIRRHDTQPMNAGKLGTAP